MIKSVFLLMTIIMLIPFASASIIISEVEQNPTGDDSGNEWVELFSDSETNLDGYILKNNDEGNFSLNNSINGYLVIIFPKQWLDNSNEKVSLINNGNIVYEIPILNDSKNNDLTWSLCSNEWKFINSTKGLENCVVEAADELEDANFVNDSIEESSEENIIVNNNSNIVNNNVEESSKENERNIEITNNSDNKDSDKEESGLSITGQAIKQEQNKLDESDNVYESKSTQTKKNAVYIFASILIIAIAYFLVKDKA